MSVVTLVSGQTQEVSGSDVVIVCGICGDEYVANITYCDNTFDCACDSGESLIAL